MSNQKILTPVKKYLIDTIPLVKWLYRIKRNYSKRKAFAGFNLEGVFTKIYQDKMWYFGTQPEKVGYYSGTGSYGESADSYTRLVVKLVNENHIRSIVDIGSGDFAIGKSIIDSAPGSLQYFGCDIVKEVVEYNEMNYANDRVHFFHLDACVDPLPNGDLLTIRQVLQHLGNRQIMQILDKSKSYKQVLITEHQLAEGQQRVFNADKPAGPDIRLVKGSGVYLDKPPFNLNVKEVLRCREDVRGKEAYIVSYLLTNHG